MGDLKIYGSYNEAVCDYLLKFHMLRDSPVAPSHMVIRGADGIAATTLIERAGEIAQISNDMIMLSKGYLDDPDPKVREGISGQLFSQVAAELSVAAELLEISEEGEIKVPAPITRLAMRGSILREAIAALEKTMSEPVMAGLDPFMQVARTARTESKHVDEAKQSLKEATTISAEAIVNYVIDSGGNIASKLVFETEWSAVIKGAGIMSSKAEELLNSLNEGLGDLFAMAARVAAKTLLNVYDKILLLLGKDFKNNIIKRIRKWLEKIKIDGKIDGFDYLISRFYRVDNLRKDLAHWLDSTKVDVVKINATTTSVTELSQKFIILVGRINKISDIVGVVNVIKMPQVHLVITGIRVALLASLVYVGYDYIGYKQIRFPNLTKGVAEVIKENLFPGV